MEDMESTETSKFHVFKPHEVDVKDEEQRNKINQLLNTVKLVQEGKVDVQNVKNATKVLKDGPDPLKFEEIAKTHEDENEDVRNEVKRQEERKQEEQKQEEQKQEQKQVEQQQETTTEQFTTIEESPTVVTGIKKFMIYILGNSEFWFRRIIQGLTKFRNVLTNLYDRIRNESIWLDLW